MKAEPEYMEERIKGKSYDLKLFINLFPYVRKYRRLILASVLLVVLITLLDLAIPYITKVAIDRYIVPAIAAGSTGSSADSDEKERLLVLDTTRPEAKALLEKYADIIIREGDTAKLAFKDLAMIEKADLVVLRGRDIHGLTMIAMLFLAAVVLNFLINFAQKIIMELAGHRIMHDLRMQLFNHLLTLSTSFYNKNSVARLVTRVTNDIQNMHELFTSVISFVFKDLFLLIGIALVLMSLHMKLALACFVILPFVVIFALSFSSRIRDVFRELRIKVAQINTHFAETVGGIKVLQSFGRERDNYRRFSHLNHENYLLGMRQIHIFAVFMPTIELLGVISIAIVIYFGGRGVLDDSISLGVLVAFITYMKMFFRPIRDLAEKYNILQNAMASAERIFHLLQTDDKIDDAFGIREKGKIPEKHFNELEFDRVAFSYNRGEPVLDRISFSLKRGEKLAVVGPTGSGKTTLINLIARFYNIDSGCIRINGDDISKMPVHQLRSMMAIVGQDPFLFSGPVRDNILLNSGNVSEDRLQEIIRSACCDAFIQGLPDGLDTRLNEAGSSLSAGERQLLSIARAFGRDPSLIILDEATSYIDSDTEIKLQEALGNLMSGRTSIIIAHRLTTARNADKIMVLNHGRIVEMGNHAELMAKKGFYYRLIQLQNNNRDGDTGTAKDQESRVSGPLPEPRPGRS